MSSSRCLVSQLGNDLWRSPQSTGCPGKMWWLLLWGVFQACPTQGSVLLAQQLPQQLTSPGYPEPYRKGQESSTDIEAPDGFAVRLVFQDFDLEPSQDYVNHSRRPISQASGASKAISTRGDPDPLKIQNHCCREPYYQAVPAGTLNCTRQNPWKETQDRKELPHCVPVCGRPVAPIAQSQEAAGSSRAKLGNFPWQAFTSIYGRGGGALLGDRWILTAAHTIHPKDGVLLGKNRSVHVFLGHTSIDEMLRRGSHPVRRVVVHPDYRQHESRNFDGDLALLELQRRVPLGPSLLPVCLPEREALYRSGVWGYVSGFGVDLGWLTTELKYSRLPVAPRAACQAWLQDKQRSEVFSANMFCAGDKMRQQSVCQGDSGGVYVVWDERAHHWVATGIVSWGIGCGKGYGFYTKVLNYLDWIKGVMDGKD
ncbi:complement C1r subcomponent-like protein isoform X6 [Canis lupus familiaris]|uniref:complement C1r subcomponent-like protein isoform X6 n=1 Tax=Canis lupus familiaris TaxID=9615 RepID=UPI0003AE540F|nr:complement C1r subcomponent-like protein isoform X6 [Canis lupus familiaris]XP_025327759.1 complement C1r subcomponent-like protein isoform X6 [Canis lupus dingo]|eukprot:XP_005637265.1 complement C1r subcomponent-like protein isoform X4 [Canis lupus familiaris]